MNELGPFIVILGLVAFVVNVILIVKFFKMSSDIGKIRRQLSGERPFEHMVNDVNLAIFKGAKSEALDLLKTMEFRYKMGAAKQKGVAAANLYGYTSSEVEKERTQLKAREVIHNELLERVNNM